MKESVDRNFNLRREIWGDEALGGPSGPNLRMIEVGTLEGDHSDRATPRNGGEAVRFRKRDRDDPGFRVHGGDDYGTARVGFQFRCDS